MDSAPSTFRWLFDESQELLRQEKDLQISFKDWLRHGSGVFHVSGKPGAGKSTLMKFIAEHEELEHLLQEWAGFRRIISAKFFFWKPGTEDQKSLRGLKPLTGKRSKIERTGYPQCDRS